MSVSIKVEISKRLKDWRMLTATTNNVELYRILHNETINIIANELPTSNVDLLAIKGLGPSKVKKYGPDILKIVADCQNQSESPQTVDPDESISVSELLTRINFSLAKHTIRVSGEVYGSVNSRGKAVYFKIKDLEQNALLECFAWTDTFSDKGTYPKEGSEVVLEGQVQIYPPTGRFSLQVKLLELRGEGLLKQAYEKLKTELEKSGAFNENLKRSLPIVPRNIAVITAVGSDAETDFLTHVGQHGFNINQYDVRVEGIKSESEIVQAFKNINSSGFAYDCVVITRGGGSLEALQGYNSKSVVEAVQGCRFPVISAVGHERDVTLCDLVADKRVSTPTDAGKLLDRYIIDFILNAIRMAEKSSNSIDNLMRIINNRLESSWQNISRKIFKVISDRELQFVNSLKSLSYQFQIIEANINKPLKIYHQIRYACDSMCTKYNSKLETDKLLSRNRLDETLTMVYRSIEQNSQLISYRHEKQLRDIKIFVAHTDQVAKKLTVALDKSIVDMEQYIFNTGQTIKLQNPETILKKGYSIVTVGNKIVRSVDQVQTGDNLNVQLLNGKVEAIVK